ncbi:MAG: hypothetical protein ACRBDL_11205 [Alphaproteobacteria bacterium]
MAEDSKSPLTKDENLTLFILMIFAWGTGVFFSSYLIYQDSAVLLNALFLWMSASLWMGFIGSVYLLSHKKWAAQLCLFALTSVSLHSVMLWFIKANADITWSSVFAVLGGYAIIQTNWHKFK